MSCQRQIYFLAILVAILRNDSIAMCTQAMRDDIFLSPPTTLCAHNGSFGEFVLHSFLNYFEMEINGKFKELFFS